MVASAGKKKKVSSRVTTPIAVKAKNDILFRSKEINRALDRMWSEAGKAPMYQRVVGQDKNGKVIKRSTKRIGGHAFGIAASGAAQAIAREQQLDSAMLGLKYHKTVEGAPITQAQVAMSGRALAEEFMGDYVQEVLWNVKNVLFTIKKHKRLNRDVIKLACTEANANIFQGTGLAPRAVYVVPLPKKKHANKDYVPPSAAEQGAEEAADEAAVAAEEGEE